MYLSIIIHFYANSCHVHHVKHTYTHQLDELQNATQQIPESLRFPFPLIKESTSLILNVIQLSVCFIDNKLMFMIHIPLVVPMEFEYFAVTPLPVKLQNNTFVFIKPNQPYFSVAISRNQFSHLDEIELNKCYKLTHQDIVCKNNNLFSIANIAESCEAQLYFSPQTLPQACDVRIINFHVTIWKKFKYANKWLFVAPSTEAITIGCGKAGAFDLIINGTGVLEVYPPCVVYTKHFVLNPRKFFNATLQRNFIPLLNITTSSLDLKTFHLDELSLPKEIQLKSLDTSDLDVASFKLNQLRDRAESIKFRNQHASHTNFLTYCIAILTIIVIVIILWRFRNIICCWRRRVQPEEHGLNQIPPVQIHNEIRMDEEPLQGTPRSNVTSPSQIDNATINSSSPIRRSDRLRSRSIVFRK
uniref:Envelope fusion protein n=1 Tax=Lygus hesperus TaxID=30085 RepID=A0A146KU86_LYGHE